MAVRIDAQTDRLYATTGLPSGSTYTALAWVSITTIQAKYTNFFLFMGASNNLSLGTFNDGTKFNIGDNSSDGTSAINMAAGSWYRVAVVVTGTTAVGYVASATGAFTTVNMTLGSGAFTPTQVCIGGDSYTPTPNTSWLNGRVAAAKVYNAALTAAEIDVELSQYQPSRTLNLVRWHPFVATELTDYSGNGNTLTAGTTATTTEDGPPLRWGRSRGPRIKKTAPTDIIVDLAAIDITVETPAVDPANIVDADAIDVTVQTAVVDPANIVDVNPIDTTVETSTTNALRVQVLRPTPVDVTVESVAVDPGWISDVSPVDVTVQPTLVDPANIVDADPIDITVQVATATALRVQVLRPTPVDVTVEIPAATFARGKLAPAVDVTVQPTTITWPRVAKPSAIDVTVDLPALTVRLTNIVRPTPIDVTVETPTATADVIHEIEVFPTPIDITVDVPKASSAVVRPAGPIDVTVETLAVDPAWITDVNPIDVTVEIPDVTTRVTKNVSYIDTTVTATPVTVGRYRNVAPVDVTVETPAVETDHIYKPTPVDVTVDLPVVKTIRTSYGIGAINTTVDPLTVDVANIVDAPPIDITVEIATVDYYRTITLQPVDTVVEPTDVGLIQSSYSVGYIDITVSPLQPRITRDFEADPVDITVETADVVMGQVKPVEPVNVTPEAATASAVVAKNIRQPIDITVETVGPLELEYVAKLPPIDVTIDTPALDNAYRYTIGAVDITVQSTQTGSTTVKTVGVIDITVESVPGTMAHQAKPNIVDTVVETTVVDPALIVDIDPINITVQPANVITIITKRVAAIDIIVQPTVMQKLQHVTKLPAFDITVQPALMQKLLKAADFLPIDISVFTLPATGSSFDDTPIDINIELPPVTVGFSVEDFSRIKDLPRPAYVQPTRIIAQDILTKRFLHWELPVSNLTITYTLSGAKIISGEFSNEIRDLRDLGLEPWGTWIHVEENGVIRGSGILQPRTLDENETLSLEAVGVSAYPAGQPFDAFYEGINLDPADIVRAIWAHLQTFPDANFGVQVTGSTTVKLGKPLPPPPPNPLPEDYVEPDNSNDKPYSLVWWEAPDCGSEIVSLAEESPFDFVERDVWNADKTDVLHYIDIGFPRIGRRRDDLRFAQEENLRKAIGPEETDDFYASSVILLGKGEGTAMIRGYAGRPYKNRVRRTVILDDSTIDNVARANALCVKELDRRQALSDVKEIEIDARHPNARLGEFSVGDDIPLVATVPWLGDINQWERVLSYTYYPDDEIIRVQLRRSESFVYGTGS